MSEQFDPGRVGVQFVFMGPSVTAFPNRLAIQERYSDNWSRAWAISYDGSQGIPSHVTMGWWLLAEFKTREETKDYLNQLLHVWGGSTTMAAKRRRSQIQEARSGWTRYQCPECGGTVLKVSDDSSNVVCDQCGIDAPKSLFERKPA
jgi:ribosomal protein S27E